MSLWPKEHGAYGQITFPLVTAFAVAGISTAGGFVAAAVVAGFLAHEPAAILAGLRGPRAKREVGRAAMRRVAVCLGIGAGAGIGALVAIDPAARWSLAIPFVPALLLAAAVARGREKSWPGEVAAALAFSGAAVPVVLAAGGSPRSAAAVAVPFALLFVASTLAVRVVILRVRGGGDTRAAAITRRAAFLLAAAGGAVLAALAAVRLLSPWVLAAAAPGLLTAAAVAARPPSPVQLRALGWTLIAISLATALIVVVVSRLGPPGFG